MVRPEIKSATRLQRRRTIPHDQRTDQRAELADWIEAHVIDGDRDWRAWTMTEIAEEFGCSRQHVANVLDAYFEPDTDDEEFIDAVADGAADVDDQYQRVYAAGFQDGVRFARDNPELFK